MILEKIFQSNTLRIWRNLTNIRRYSDGKVKTTSVSDIESEYYESDEYEKNPTQDLDRKLLRVAIVGVPNAGKSTLINNLVDHRVCPVSSKVHTTRNFSRAVVNQKNTQIVLFDTPGLITDREIKKHHLEQSFTSAYRHSIQNSDVIGVVHDVSNTWTRTKLHPTVIKALEEFNQKPSVLILNKVDALRSKRVLLDLSRQLTRGIVGNKPIGSGKPKITTTDPDSQTQNESDDKGTWPGFDQVFMISALSGDGVYRLMKYFVSQAKPRSWIFEPDTFTDTKPENLIVDTIKARLLDFLPQEIPYHLKCEIEYFSIEKDELFASVLVTCPNPRIERLVCGVSNGKLKQITEQCTSDLIESFEMPVSLTISTKHIKQSY